jgi:hypothetical protein
LTFVFLEQLRKHFGYLQPKWDVRMQWFAWLARLLFVYEWRTGDEHIKDSDHHHQGSLINFGLHLW